MTDLRKQNLAKDVDKDPKNAEMLRKLESLEIKDGKIILKVRAKPGATACRARRARSSRAASRSCLPEQRSTQDRAVQERGTETKGHSRTGPAGRRSRSRSMPLNRSGSRTGRSIRHPY